MKTKNTISIKYCCYRGNLCSFFFKKSFSKISSKTFSLIFFSQKYSQKKTWKTEIERSCRKKQIITILTDERQSNEEKNENFFILISKNEWLKWRKNPKTLPVKPGEIIIDFFVFCFFPHSELPLTCKFLMIFRSLKNPLKTVLKSFSFLIFQPKKRNNRSIWNFFL